MSKTNYFTKIDGKKVTSAENIVKRHGGELSMNCSNYHVDMWYVHVGVLGLCAIVLSSPYEIPMYVPEALMLLCEHSHDPDLIQVSLIICLCKNDENRLKTTMDCCRNR